MMNSFHEIFSRNYVLIMFNDPLLRVLKFRSHKDVLDLIYKGSRKRQSLVNWECGNHGGRKGGEWRIYSSIQTIKLKKMYWNHSCICMLNRMPLRVVAYCVKRTRCSVFQGSLMVLSVPLSVKLNLTQVVVSWVIMKACLWGTSCS